MTKKLQVANWNILANSLAKNEFICHDEISLKWDIRGPKIINIIFQILKTTQVLVLEECDEYQYFEQIFSPNIKNLGKNVVILWNNVEYIDSDGMSCKFVFDGCIFNIYALHLKSGEGENNAIKRLEQLKNAFIDSKHKINPIFIMDSNNSEFYELEYSEESKMSNLIEQYGFKNVVQSKGNECFKLRHNHGNQPSKFFELMFDTIDKILVQTDIDVEIEPIESTDLTQTFGFKKYNIANHEYLRNVRLNERDEFKNSCLSNNVNSDDSHEFFSNEIFHDLYPNLDAPSDHPPIYSVLYIPMLFDD